MNDDYTDLKASLEWGAKLELTAEQRASLKTLCCKIAGISPADGIPSWRLKEEAEAKRAALRRVAELEASLRPSGIRPPCCPSVALTAYLHSVAR